MQPEVDSIHGSETVDSVELNKVFHDHECAYYDERFGINHSDESAAKALRGVEELLGQRLTSGDSVLDVGCGTGWFAAGLQRAAPEVEVYGLDLSSGMLGRAREAGATNLIQGDATHLPLADDSIDLVVGRGVLHHLPEPVAALTEWRRVLKPSGALALSSEPTPTVESHGAVLVKGLLLLPGFRGGLAEEDEFWELAAMAANLHTFTRDELTGLCYESGFTDVGIRSAGFAETLVMTASYVSHGHAPEVAKRVPWGPMVAAAGGADRYFWNRLLPDSARHTLQGVVRP